MKLPGRKFLFRLCLIAWFGLMGLYMFARYYLSTDTAERQLTELLEREFDLSARWSRVSFSWKFAPRFQSVVLRSPKAAQNWQLSARRLDMNYDPGNIWIDIHDGRLQWESTESLDVDLQQAQIHLQKLDDQWRFQSLAVKGPTIVLPKFTSLFSNPIENGTHTVASPHELPDLPDTSITEGRAQLTLPEHQLLIEHIRLDIHQERTPGSSSYYTASFHAYHPGGPIHLLFSLPTNLSTFAWSGSIAPGLPVGVLPDVLQPYLPNSPALRTAGAIQRTHPAGNAWIELAAELPDEATAFISTHFNFSEQTNTIGQIFTDANLFISPQCGWPVTGSLAGEFDIAPASHDGSRDFTFDIPSAEITFATPEMSFLTGPANAYCTGRLDPNQRISVEHATLRMNHPQLDWNERTIESQPLSLDLREGTYQTGQFIAKQLNAILGDIASLQARQILAGTNAVSIAQSSITLPDIAESMQTAHSITGVTFPFNVSGTVTISLKHVDWQKNLKADAIIQAASLHIQSQIFSGTTGTGQASLALRPKDTTATLALEFETSRWFEYEIDDPVRLTATALCPQYSFSTGWGQWSLAADWLNSEGNAEWDVPQSQWSLHSSHTQLEVERLAVSAQDWLEPEQGQLILDSTRTPTLTLAARGDAHGIQEATGTLQWEANSLGYIAADRLAGIENLNVDASARYIHQASGEEITIESIFEHPEFFFNDVAIDLGPVATRLENRLVRQQGKWIVQAIHLDAPSFTAKAGRSEDSDSHSWNVNAQCTNAQRFSTLVASSLLAERYPNFSPCMAEGSFEIDGIVWNPFDSWRFQGHSQLDLSKVTLGSIVSMDRLYANLPFDLDAYNTPLSEAKPGEVIIENATWGVVSIPQAHLTPTLHGQSVSWPQELTVRIYNGDVTFGPPTYNHIFTKDWNLTTSIQLQEINLHQLGVMRESEKNATLSADLSRILLSRGWLQSEGQFTAKVFGGTIVASNVAVSDPMTDYPVWRADIELDRVKLTRLTRYAGFGEIDGKLQGSIRNLELDCTQSKIVPIGFDLDIWTQEDETGVLSMEALRMITDISEHPALLLPTIGSKGFTFARFGFRSTLDNDRFFIWGRYTEDQQPYDLESSQGECYFVLPPRDFLSLFTTRHRLTLTTQHPRKPVSFQHFWKRLTEQLKKSETAPPPPPRVARRFQIPLIDKLLPHGQGNDE